MRKRVTGHAGWLSNAQVCGSSTAGIAGSKPAEGMDGRPFCMLCCVRNGLCDEILTRSEESYRVSVCVCLIVRDLET